jgi:hypothetical protein
MNDRKNNAWCELYEVLEMMEGIPEWKRFYLVTLFKFEVVKVRAKRKLISLRAVIVSACYRARVFLLGTPTEQAWKKIFSHSTERTWEQLFSQSTEKERLELLLIMARIITRRRRRAVIVSACYRAGMTAAGVCDLLSMCGVPVIYSLLFLLIFSVM